MKNVLSALLLATALATAACASPLEEVGTTDTSDDELRTAAPRIDVSVRGGRCKLSAKTTEVREGKGLRFANTSTHEVSIVVDLPNYEGETGPAVELTLAPGKSAYVRGRRFSDDLSAPGESLDFPIQCAVAPNDGWSGPEVGTLRITK